MEENVEEFDDIEIRKLLNMAENINSTLDHNSVSEENPAKKDSEKQDKICKAINYCDLIHLHFVCSKRARI